ncbi:MAG: hypothetical protein M3032_01735 [Verrucomicrobiota bacterium]|nr:hypothetical protein [Verrucomicrobiota bacterium]
MPAAKKDTGRKAATPALPGQIIIQTRGGQKITLADRRKGIEITDQNGNAIRLEPGGITILASAKITVRAAEIELAASLCNVDAAVTKFSGVVQCDTLISNSVVSASYTPGAGNLM